MRGHSDCSGICFVDRARGRREKRGEKKKRGARIMKAFAFVDCIDSLSKATFSLNSTNASGGLQVTMVREGKEGELREIFCWFRSTRQLLSFLLLDKHLIQRFVCSFSLYGLVRLSEKSFILNQERSKTYICVIMSDRFPIFPFLRPQRCKESSSSTSIPTS